MRVIHYRLDYKFVLRYCSVPKLTVQGGSFHKVVQDKLNRVNLTLYGPCIVIYLRNKNQPDVISLYILQFHLTSVSSQSSLMHDTYRYLHIQ